MWRTMQAEPSTSVPYMAHDAVKVLILLLLKRDRHFTAISPISLFVANPSTATATRI